LFLAADEKMPTKIHKARTAKAMQKHVRRRRRPSGKHDVNGSDWLSQPSASTAQKYGVQAQDAQYVAQVGHDHAGHAGHGR
jgi:hypothetical protein